MLLDIIRVLLLCLLFHVGSVRLQDEYNVQGDPMNGVWLQMSDERCVLFGKDFAPWDISREICQNRYGGDIMSIRNMAELNWVKTMMDSYFLARYEDHYWLGLYRNESDATFYWVDGSPGDETIPHLEWIFSQPNYSPYLCSSDDCVHYGNTYMFTSVWDSQCSNHYKYICAKDTCLDGVDPRDHLCTPEGLLDQRVCAHFGSEWRSHFIYQDAALKCRGHMKPDHRPHTFSEADLNKFTDWAKALSQESRMWIIMDGWDTSKGCPYTKQGEFVRNGSCQEWMSYICPQPFEEFWANTGPVPVRQTICAQIRQMIESKMVTPYYLIFLLFGVTLGLLFVVAFLRVTPSSSGGVWQSWNIGSGLPGLDKKREKGLPYEEFTNSA